MRPIREAGAGQRQSSHGYAIRQLQRRPAPDLPASSSGDLIWASANASSATLTPSGGIYRPRFDGVYSGTATDFEAAGVSGGRADWLQLNTPGYYVAEFFVIQNSLTVWSNAGDTFVQPLFESLGSPASIQDNQGVADYLGDWFNARDEVKDSGDAHAGTLNISLTFNWDPANPVSDIDQENPLKIGVHVATFPADGTNLAMAAGVFVCRIAAPGYVDLSP